MSGPQASLASPREMPASNPRVSLTAGGLIVEWEALEARLLTGPDGLTQIDMPGFELLDVPGVPRLPYASVLVALPPGSNPGLEISSSNTTSLNLPSRLALGEQPYGVIRDSSVDVIGGAFSASTAAAGKEFPVVTLEDIGVMRGVHLGRLSFYPAIPEGKNLRVTNSVKVEVSFGPQLQISDAERISPNPVLDQVRSAVINPEQVQSASRNQQSTLAEPALQLVGTATVAVEVLDRGITEITSADLASVGITSINPNNLGLTRGGGNIAFEWIGDGDSNFEANEMLRFFADPRFSRWTKTDTYLLHLDGTGRDLMGSRNISTGTISTSWAESVFEDNEIYTPGCYCAPIPAGRDGDRWVGYQLQRPGVSSHDIPFDLPGFDRTKNATLKLWLIGFTDVSANPDHKVNVAIKVFSGSSLIQTLNLGSIQFNGKSSYQADLGIPNTLAAGDYQLSLTIPGDTPGAPVDGVWLDAFSIRYALSSTISAGQSIAFSGTSAQRTYTVNITKPAGKSYLAYDISNPAQPQILTGIQVSGSQVKVADPSGSQTRDYWVTSTGATLSPVSIRPLATLAGTPGFSGADYVIISPAEFIPFLEPLVALHEPNGLEVIVEDVQAIYDIFGGGRPLPEAIRDYLEMAYFDWDQPPLYVLLAGDGTHDPKRYRDTSTNTLIPPYLEDVDPWAGETAADNRYVTVDGSDALPDMIIGRLPANNPTELATMVSKISQYGLGHALSLWKHRAIFVADDTDPASGDFASLSDILINKFPNFPFAAQRLYFKPSQSTPAAFRAMLNLEWDKGEGLIMFSGHASIHQWAHEILFHLEDVPGLNNGPRLPVLLEMTCFTGSFQIPDYPTLDESLLRQPGGGAVAAWGATGLGISTGHHWLAEGFMKSIYQDGDSEIGLAALAGKLNLASVGSNPDLIDTFTLLGDPATKLEYSYQTYLPTTQK